MNLTEKELLAPLLLKTKTNLILENASSVTKFLLFYFIGESESVRTVTNSQKWMTNIITIFIIIFYLNRYRYILLNNKNNNFSTKQKIILSKTNYYISKIGKTLENYIELYEKKSFLQYYI